MRSEELLAGLKTEGIKGKISAEITDICADSRKVGKGSLFIALKGTHDDGGKYIAAAAQAGAVAAVCEEFAPLELPQIKVKDARAAFASLCGRFFGDPAQKLKMVGVTGTNGKSTVAYLVQQIACRCGMRCGLIGTMYISDGEKRYPALLTTPDPWELNKTLAQFVQSGCRAAVMEVSAHALYWRKTDNIRFDIGVFTNLTRDHLDFFGDMRAYALAKRRLFAPERVKKAVINSDDEEGVRLLNCLRVPLISYGLDNPADVFAVNIAQGEKCRYVVNDRDCLMDISSRLFGRFNVSNSLAAIACARELGLDCAKIADAMAEIAPPEGRFNVYQKDGRTFIIDFAHTPDGLKNVLEQARALCSGKLTVVFGCGGDRDKSKRAMMGGIAEALADRVVITADNPRSERREDVAADILKGIKGEAVVIHDRPQALEYACKAARRGDVVVIAGKGSEGYIEENNVKTPYEDKKQLMHILDEKWLSD